MGFCKNPSRLDCNRDWQILTAVHKDSVEIAAVLEIGVVVVAASGRVGARKRAAATNGASRREAPEATEAERETQSARATKELPEQPGPKDWQTATTEDARETRDPHGQRLPEPERATQARHATNRECRRTGNEQPRTANH